MTDKNQWNYRSFTIKISKPKFHIYNVTSYNILFQGMMTQLKVSYIFPGKYAHGVLCFDLFCCILSFGGYVASIYFRVASFVPIPVKYPWTMWVALIW